MGETVKVKVKPGWAVHDGTAHRSDGAVLDVDADTARHWLAAGWVELVTEPAALSAPKTPVTRRASA